MDLAHDAAPSVFAIDSAAVGEMSMRGAEELDRDADRRDGEQGRRACRSPYDLNFLHGPDGTGARRAVPSCRPGHEATPMRVHNLWDSSSTGRVTLPHEQSARLIWNPAPERNEPAMQIKGANSMGTPVVAYDFTTWTKYAPAFAALTPSMGQVYFNISQLRAQVIPFGN